jgi:hypothetical protein
MAHLVIKVNGKEFGSLNLHGPTLIGRAADCRISIQDTLISRHHLRLLPNPNAAPNAWLVVDLASSNGTRVDGAKIQRYPLSDRDMIEAGHVALIFFEDSLAEGGTGDGQNPLLIGEKALNAQATLSPTLPSASRPEVPIVKPQPQIQIKHDPKPIAPSVETWETFAKERMTKPMEVPTLGERFNRMPRAVALTAVALTGIILFALAFYVTNLVTG